MPSPWLALSLLILIGLASASTIFHPNCSIPSQPVNLVLAPGVRGTFDILWTCVFTLLVCTWTVQHLNIPEQSLKELKTLWDGLKDFFRRKGCKSFRER